MAPTEKFHLKKKKNGDTVDGVTLNCGESPISLEMKQAGSSRPLQIKLCFKGKIRLTPSLLLSF